MPRREDVLAKETFKEEGMAVEKRVFYTLSDKEKSQEHRNSKAISLLFKALIDDGNLTDEQLDTILFEVIS